MATVLPNLLRRRSFRGERVPAGLSPKPPANGPDRHSSDEQAGGQVAGEQVAEGREADVVADRTAARWAWIFVGIGIFDRVLRWCLAFPLWGDESFLALNIIRRDYEGLTHTLDTTQVAPIGYLWWEKSLIETFGCSELSLRGAALISGVAALVLFRLLAGRLLRGTALVAAVGVFAVSYYPLRHAVECKPYASDLLASVLILWAAVEWRIHPRSLLRSFGLVGAALVALPLSYPAAFVAGGISLALLAELISGSHRGQEREPRAWPAWLAYNGAVALMFGVIYWLIVRNQFEDMAVQLQATGKNMEWHWREGFPPSFREPWMLLKWLVAAHTGEALAYPLGGDSPTCIPQAVLMIAGGIVLWRRGRRFLPPATVGMLGLALLAAFLEKYPYGYGERVQQHWVPLVCLLLGSGYSWALGLVSSLLIRRRLIQLGGVLLLVLGAAWPAIDVARPYKAANDRDHQEFSRWFWRFGGNGEPLLCVSEDFGIRLFDPFQEITYHVNKAIYREPQGPGGPERLAAVPRKTPIKCVAFSYKDTVYSKELFERFIDSLEACGYLIVEERRYDVRIDHSPGMPVTYYVWRFEPTRPDADLTQFKLLDKPVREFHSKPHTQY
jgi:hypothetical protein